MGADTPLSSGGADDEVRTQALPAVVAELLPNATCRVKLDDQRLVIAHAASTAVKNFVRLRAGDRVMVAISPTDRTRGRIVKILPD